MEHRTGSSQDGLSNLQRKVLKNTFVNNSNNLRLREDSRSKQASSDWFSRGESRPVEMSGIAQVPPGFSMSQSVSKLFGEMGSGTEQGMRRGDADLAARLQDTLLRAEAGSVILLPPERISVSTLRICNPLTLKGSPGTVLEVTNGSIVVDFSSHSKESLVGRATDRVEICELSITYRADHHCLDAKAPVALFIVDSPYSFLEVRDCDIRSESQETGDVSGSSGPYMVQDVCLWVNGLSSRQTQSGDKGLCSAFMTSCNVTGFHEFVKGGANCKIHVERCHISDCSSNAFALLNPKEVLIQQSVIERCQASSIDIRLKNDPGSKLPSRSGSLTTINKADRNWDEISPAISVLPPGKPAAVILTGGQLLAVSSLAPSCEREATRSPMGRSRMRGSPSRRYSPYPSVRKAERNLAAVPALPMKSSALFEGILPPKPVTIIS